jgi:hypothetical protein
MGKLKDLTGRRFGKLVVQKRSKKTGCIQWICLCDCGKKKNIRAGHLTNKPGGTTSCSCVWAARRIEGNFKHGLCKTPKWNVWSNAKSRAKKKGILFAIEFKNMPEVPEVCPILGIPLFRGVKVASPNSPSLDRIIPSKGYVLGNIQIISQRANAIKSDATIEEVGKVYHYMKENKCQ